MTAPLGSTEGIARNIVKTAATRIASPTRMTAASVSSTNPTAMTITPSATSPMKSRLKTVTRRCATSDMGTTPSTWTVAKY